MRLFLCTGLSLLYSLSMSYCNTQQANKNIIAMRCVYTNWSVLIRSSQTPHKFLMRPRELKDSTITYDKNYLQTLQNQIEQLREAPDTAHVDVRTICLLETDKGTIDTLSLGNFEVCQYNNKYYYLTWDLFQTIMKKLPPDEAIDFWLQDEHSLKERMIENGKR